MGVVLPSQEQRINISHYAHHLDAIKRALLIKTIAPLLK